MRKRKEWTEGKTNSESAGKSREWKIQSEILLKEKYIK